jgi:hypothetical protein
MHTFTALLHRVQGAGRRILQAATFRPDQHDKAQAHARAFSHSPTQRRHPERPCYVGQKSWAEVMAELAQSEHETEGSDLSKIDASKAVIASRIPLMLTVLRLLCQGSPAASAALLSRATPCAQGLSQIPQLLSLSQAMCALQTVRNSGDEWAVNSLPRAPVFNIPVSRSTYSTASLAEAPAIYRVSVVTGDVRGAGTSAPALVRLVGDSSESEDFLIGNDQVKGFHRLCV